MNQPASDLELMELQARTLFVHDDAGRLIRPNEPSNAPAPRFFLGRTAAGNIWRARCDLPDDVAAVLESLAASEPVTADVREAPANLERYRATLATQAPIAYTYHGPAYYFPADIEAPLNTLYVTADEKNLLRRGFPSLLAEIKARQPCAAVAEGGHAVSICCSARITNEAAEAGVETIEAFHGRGYATRAVAAWALAVRAMGRIPLYSTSWDNLASQGVARKLGLVMYGTDFHLT